MLYSDNSRSFSFGSSQIFTAVEDLHGFYQDHLSCDSDSENDCSRVGASYVAKFEAKYEWERVLYENGGWKISLRWKRDEYPGIVEKEMGFGMEKDEKVGEEEWY